MKAVIMAGGKGTRLLPLTENLPKPLVTLCAKPVCCHILDLLKKHGCTEATFTLMYKGDMIEGYFDGQPYNGIKLNFSYEDKPLGTAGCVKKAAADYKYNEPFVVISGDAMCSFNLSAAMAFHKSNGTAATIITKQTDDPREFGIVTHENNIVTGFIEKPSFIGCIENSANTGVYILSPEILNYISDGFCDFACDVFPAMLKNNSKISAYEENGYWCDIGDLKAYKRCQRDMLEGRTGARLDVGKITENGYCGSACGNYSNLRPPYFIGSNVKIGENTIIRDGSVIGDNVTISSGCTVDGAIIQSGAYIGNNVRLNDCIICSDVSIKSDSAVYENAVIGNGAVVGRGCIIMPEIRIWSNKQTADNTTLSYDIEKNARRLFSLDDNGFSGETNITATPQTVAKLGSALASASDGSICVGSRADDSSSVMAMSLISGICAAGCSCISCGAQPLSALIHKGRLTDCSLIAHISSEAKTTVTILSGNGMPITRKQERTIEGIMNRGGAARADYRSFGKHIKCSDSGVLYTAMLSRCADFSSGYNIQLDCSNRLLKEYAAPVFDQISDKKGKRMIVSVDYSGTKAEIFTAETDIVSMEKLLLIAFTDLLEKGNDIALPYNMLFDMEQMAKDYKPKVYRYHACSNDNSDSTARKIAAAEPFITDGCILALYALSVVKKSGLTFEKLCRSLPEFVREKRYVPIKQGSALPLMKRLCGTENSSISANEGVMISVENSKVLIRSGRNGKGLYLFSQSLNAETAKELCDFAEKKIKSIQHDK